MVGTSTLPHEDDATLVARCLEGDGAAWQTLMNRHGRLIYSIPARMGLSLEDRADVMQSVALSLFDNLDSVRDRPRLSSWLAKTAANASRRILRERPPEIQVAPHWFDALAAGESGMSPRDRGRANPPDDDAGQIEEQCLVRQGLERLAPGCRTLLVALYYERPTPGYQKVAERLGMQPGSIGSRRARCLDKLRTILKELGLP